VEPVGAYGSDGLSNVRDGFAYCVRARTEEADDVDFDLDRRGDAAWSRGCICAKRAPLPGPCQARAERGRVPRMAGDWAAVVVYLELGRGRQRMEALDMAGVRSDEVLWGRQEL